MGTDIQVGITYWWNRRGDVCWYPRGAIKTIIWRLAWNRRHRGPVAIEGDGRIVVHIAEGFHPVVAPGAISGFPTLFIRPRP